MGPRASPCYHHRTKGRPQATVGAVTASVTLRSCFGVAKSPSSSSYSNGSSTISVAGGSVVTRCSRTSCASSCFPLNPTISTSRAGFLSTFDCAFMVNWCAEFRRTRAEALRDVTGESHRLCAPILARRRLGGGRLYANARKRCILSRDVGVYCSRHGIALQACPISVRRRLANRSAAFLQSRSGQRAWASAVGLASSAWRLRMAESGQGRQGAAARRPWP
jgi:hypothetical protein